MYNSLRLLLMHVYPSMPPYTTTSGKGWMRTDTDYETQPVGGRDSILVALDKVMLLLGQSNPVTTVPSGLFHPEFPQYPTIALREALLNAFAHRDYSIPGMEFIRHYRDRLEINSPGGFAGAVTPENILHNPPVKRNRYLAETLLLASPPVFSHPKTAVRETCSRSAYCSNVRISRGAAVNDFPSQCATIAKPAMGGVRFYQLLFLVLKHSFDYHIFKNFKFI